LSEPIKITRGERVHEQPRVSVIIPAWRGNASAPFWLDEALDSVRAQSLRDWELIVVDDGSPVPIAPARSDDMVLVRQPNTGPGGARNRGGEHARGALVAYLDADDRWRPTKLERQVALHDRRPELVLSATGLTNFDGANFRTSPGSPLGERISFERLFFENCIACSSAMMRRDALSRTPGMSPRRRMGEDYGLWLRLALLGPVGYLDEVLLERRQHGESLMQEQLRDGSWLEKERAVYDEFLDENPALREEPFVRRALGRLEFQGGWGHLQRREWDAARGALIRSLRLTPQRPKAWLNLARALLHVGPRR
jgi:glycosyltransferase involved in cell wall biosynthesis